MAIDKNLTSLGRADLDRPPAPTTPPEAAPRLAQISPAREEGPQAPSLGSLQQAGTVLQVGMAVEKGILSLASLLPGFDQVAQHIIPQLRTAIRDGLSGAQSAPSPGGEELPATQVSPLQQG